jgi:dTDP-4-amino-4,6-dideoxygalactose transaminase
MIATAFAVIYCYATPVLVDAEPETWNMDVEKMKRRLPIERKR